MTKKLIYFFFTILMISCRKENKKIEPFLKTDLYSELIKYQDENPIPISKRNLNKYSIYEMSFFKNKDTLLSITVSTLGIKTNNSFGIYKDKNLKPSYLIDSLNYGKNFINKYRKDSLDSFVPKGRPPNNDLIYPIYKYLVKGNKLYFLGSQK